MKLLVHFTIPSFRPRLLIPKFTRKIHKEPCSKNVEAVTCIFSILVFSDSQNYSNEKY